MHMGDMGDWSWAWGIFGMLMMTVFWGGLILLVVYAIRGTASRDNPGSVQDPALRTLNERYARGEIDETEYRERRRTLEGT